MTKDQIKYYHLLAEIVELRESSRLVLDDLGFDNKVSHKANIKDIRKTNKHNQKIIANPDNAIKLGEINANNKRFREIHQIIRDEYQIEDTKFLLELTREKLPKHMILPNNTYYTIEYQGETYENSPSQAVFIEKAHQLFLDGKKDFKSQNLVDIVGGYANISALFKNNDIYGKLIKSERKGIHYLDIEI